MILFRHIHDADGSQRAIWGHRSTWFRLIDSKNFSLGEIDDGPAMVRIDLFCSRVRITITEVARAIRHQKKARNA